MKLQRTILRTLLFDHASLTLILVAAIVGGIVLGGFGTHDERVPLAILAVAVPAWALLAAAAFRLEGCCESAGALGIPGHLAASRITQFVLLGLFAGIPIIHALVLTHGASVPVIILVGAAIAVLLNRPFVLPGAVAAAWASSKWHFDLWAFAGTTAGILSGVTLALLGFAVWIRMPMQAQVRGVWGSAALADARHEQVDGTLPNAPVPEFSESLPLGERLSPAAFWGALGHLPARGLPLTAIFAATWLAVFIGVHFFRHGRIDVNFFLVSSIIVGALSGYRFFGLQGVWATTGGEQAVLKLAPRWPSSRAIKWLMFRSLWEPMPASIVAWLALAVVGTSCGWLSWPLVAKGATAVVSATLALFGFLLLFLAQSRLRRRNRLAMFYLIFIGFIGIMLLLLVDTSAGWNVCCELLVGAALLPSIAFILRRPQFPVRADGDVVL